MGLRDCLKRGLKTSAKLNAKKVLNLPLSSPCEECSVCLSISSKRYLTADPSAPNPSPKDQIALAPSNALKPPTRAPSSPPRDSPLEADAPSKPGHSGAYTRSCHCMSEGLFTVAPHTSPSANKADLNVIPSGTELANATLKAETPSSYDHSASAWLYQYRHVS